MRHACGVCAGVAQLDMHTMIFEAIRGSPGRTPPCRALPVTAHLTALCAAAAKRIRSMPFLQDEKEFNFRLSPTNVAALTWAGAGPNHMACPKRGLCLHCLCALPAGPSPPASPSLPACLPASPQECSPRLCLPGKQPFSGL